jgi:uridine phosphorylase
LGARTEAGVTSPTFPNFGGKHDHDALFSPELVALGHRNFKDREWTSPPGIVLFFARTLAEYLRGRTGTTETVLPMTYPEPTLFVTSEGVGFVGGFGVGSPSTAMVLEMLIALGCRQVLNIGMCGGLQPDMAVGAIAVGTSAVRDEGVSHHYLAPARFAEPSRELTSRLVDELERRSLPYRCGPTWTIDAVFRETVAETIHYRDEGVLTVEMEAAAVYAVSAFRGVEAAGAFVIADILHPEGWQMEGLWAADARESLNALAEASIATLASA